MHVDIPSRNAQTWLLLYSAKVTQCRRLGEKAQCRNRLVTSARGNKGAQSESRGCGKSDDGENEKTRIGGNVAARREREKETENRTAAQGRGVGDETRTKNENEDGRDVRAEPAPNAKPQVDGAGRSDWD